MISIHSCLSISNINSLLNARLRFDLALISEKYLLHPNVAAGATAVAGVEAHCHHQVRQRCTDRMGLDRCCNCCNCVRRSNKTGMTAAMAAAVADADADADAHRPVVMTSLLPLEGPNCDGGM